MAEALARARYGSAVQVFSAGSEPSRVHPLALEAMRVRKLDGGAQSSKHVDVINPTGITVVVTLCAEEYCPVFLHKALRLHWPMPDPAHRMAGHSEADQLASFLEVSDLIAVRLSELDPLLRPPQRSD